MKSLILLFVSCILVLGFTFEVEDNNKVLPKTSTTLTIPTVDFRSDCVTVMSPDDLEQVIIETEDGAIELFDNLDGKTRIICSWNAQKIEKVWVKTRNEAQEGILFDSSESICMKN